MMVLWVGICALIFLGLDVWNHHRQKKAKHKKVDWWFIVLEGSVALGCFIWYLVI